MGGGNLDASVHFLFLDLEECRIKSIVSIL